MADARIAGIAGIIRTIGRPTTSGYRWDGAAGCGLAVALVASLRVEAALHHFNILVGTGNMRKNTASYTTAATGGGSAAAGAN
jgi:hypothetical protein